jgi:hypothetical protein
MPNNYRIYRFDGGNHIVGVDWLAAATDEEAVAAVRALKSSGRHEVWLGERLVAKIAVAADKIPSAGLWL